MRKLVVLILLALAMMTVAPAMAQDDTVFCGDLAAADCDLLKLSATSMETLSSATADINVQIDVENIPQTPNININLSGTAAYSVDSSAVAAMSGEELDVDGLKSLLGGFNGDLALVLSLPAELAAEAGLPASTIELQLKLVDGIGYVNFESLDALAGGALAAQGLTGWGGINFVDLIEKVAAANPDALSSVSEGASTAMMDTSALDSIAQYVNIERSADVDGAAVFVTSVDFASLVNDPAFQELVKTQAEATGQGISDADFQQAIAILNVIGNELDINVTQAIDPGTGYVLSGEINISIDLTTLMAASGQSAAGDSVISFVASIDYSGFNETTIAAPSNATIAPTEMLLGLVGGAMGQ